MAVAVPSSSAAIGVPLVGGTPGSLLSVDAGGLLAQLSAIPESQVTGLTADLAAINTSLGTKAADTAVVHLAGAESISGVKTFAPGSLPVLGTLTGLVKGAAGALSAAVAGTDYVAPGGVAGGQTINLGLNAGDPGTIYSTAHATKGNLFLNSTFVRVDAAANLCLGAIFASTGNIRLAQSIGAFYRNAANTSDCRFFELGKFSGSGMADAVSFGGGNTTAISIQAGGTIQLFGSPIVLSGTVYGDTAAGGNLNLSSTSSATKGLVTLNGSNWSVDTTGIQRNPEIVCAYGTGFLTGLFFRNSANTGDIGALRIGQVGGLDGLVIGSGSLRRLRVDVGATTSAALFGDTNITLADAYDLAFGTTTGTKIGINPTQKIGFWGATPIVQPTVTGSRRGNPALASILSQLNAAGLINDATTAGSLTITDILPALQTGTTGGTNWSLGAGPGDSGTLYSTASVTKGSLNLNGSKTSVLSDGTLQVSDGATNTANLAIDTGGLGVKFSCSAAAAAGGGLRVGSIWSGLGFYAGAGSTAYDCYIVGGTGKGAGMAGSIGNPATGQGIYVSSSQNVSVNTTSATASVNIGPIGTSGIALIAKASASGSSLQALTSTGGKTIEATAAGSVTLGLASRATTATDGFAYVAVVAGTPTGTPTAITGYAPLLIDSIGNRLWTYLGGVWLSAAFA